MHSFQYGTTTINYSVAYKKDKKDVSLSVCLNDGVQLVAPEGLNHEKLQDILHKKAPWILKKKYELEEISAVPAPKEYVSGEKFAYLGRNYRLKVHKMDNMKSPTLTFKQGRFIAEIPLTMTENEKTSKLQQLFKEWYIAHGNTKIVDRLHLYTSKMGLVPKKVVFREQQKDGEPVQKKELSTSIGE